MDPSRILTGHALYEAQRTVRGREYDAFRAATMRRYTQDDDFRKRMNDLATRIALNPNTVHTNKLMNELSIAYANDDFITERIFGTVAVTQRSDSYVIWSKRNLMNAPNDLLTTRARANEVQNEYTTDNYSLQDYGLKDFVDDQTLKNSDQVFMDVFEMVEGLLQRIALKRELRGAAIAGVAASYSGNTTSLVGSEWNATTSGGMYTGGAPIVAINTALNGMWRGQSPTRKIAFTTREVMNVLSNHQHIRGLFGLQDRGLATPAMIAGFFGIDELLIAEARYDTANIGQTASYARIWPNVFGIVHVAQRPSRKSAHFGSLFRLREDPVISEWYDPDPGKSGGHYAKAAVSEQLKVVAPDTAWLLTGVIT